MKIKKITRSYQLMSYSNKNKLEDVRYTVSRYTVFLQHFVTQLYFNRIKKSISTKGMGTLANRAQKRAMEVIAAHRALIRATNNKSDKPSVKVNYCPGVIHKSETKSFDYWVSIISQWGNKIIIPVKSHKKLNEKIKTGWALSNQCEIFFRNEKWYVRVYVTKNVLTPDIKNKSLGVDVGLVHGVTRSDGYLGVNINNIIKKQTDSQRERYKQKHKKKPFKTLVKQQLDVEVNRALTRCRRDSLNLSVENPKVLSNLRIIRWARSYFANRAITRAEEEGVAVILINPAYTSIICSRCGFLDKQSRVSQCLFICTGCESIINADLNASVNIARKGQESLSRKVKAVSAL